MEGGNIAIPSNHAEVLHVLTCTPRQPRLMGTGRGLHTEDIPAAPQTPVMERTLILGKDASRGEIEPY